MASIKISLDKRTSNLQGQNPIRLSFCINSKTAYYSFNVFAFEKDWDKTNFNVLPTDKKYKLKNKLIEDVYNEAEKFISDLLQRGRLNEDAYKVRDLFANRNNIVDFQSYMQLFINRKADRTKEIYEATKNKITKYYNKTLYFNDINLSWLNEFDKAMSDDGNATNSRAIHFRNIRAVFNDAIDNEIISADLYPFRKFKIKKETTRKRALTIRQMKQILIFRGTEQQNWARNVFFLSFYLIGINSKDLFLNPMIEDGYLTYNRAKTKRLYEIKIEQEAKNLIDQFRGKQHTFCFCEQFQHNHSFYVKCNDYLKEIANIIKITPFTMYAARHTWATIASVLEIPKETISASLGHGGNSVTDIYISFDKKKVDIANRQVIDYLFKDIREIKKFRWKHKKGGLSRPSHKHCKDN